MEWREFLYPLGFLSSIAFGARFSLQWLYSEYRGKSTVTKGFWVLSLVGNILLLIHATIQLQYHVAIVQSCNSVISWRNLNLMGAPARRVERKTVVAAMLTLSVAMTFLFYFSTSAVSSDNVTWFRVPTHSLTLWSSPSSTPFALHLFGFVGIALFSSRFWVQWWLAEREKKSYLGKSFWWLSLIGDLMSIIYFAYIGDSVNFVGPALGTIPYLRNLMLLYKNEGDRYVSA